MAPKGSMTAKRMNTWKRHVWTKRPEGLFRPRPLLVMDSATSHTEKSVMSSFKQHYATAIAIIPGGMTPLLQPADVAWINPFHYTRDEKKVD